MNLLEDLVDVYLGYIYDKELRSKVIQELVSNVWNANTDETSI